MKLYCLEKWYFDALTPDGKFVLCYLAVVRFAGFRVAALNLDVADTEGKTHIALSVPVKVPPHRHGDPVLLIHAADLEIEAGNRAARIRARRGPADIELDFASPRTSAASASPLVIAAGKRQIIWQPLIVAARVNGRIRAGDTEIRVPNSNGYVDYVASDILPPRVPVSELYWGRVHDPLLHVTYTLASGPGQRWTRLIGDAGGELFEFDDVRVKPEESERLESLNMSCPRGYALYGASHSARIEMKVQHVRSAVESEFLKTGPGPFGALLRRYTKNPKGIKFFARADIMLERNGNRMTINGIPCIDEYVRFD